MRPFSFQIAHPWFVQDKGIRLGPFEVSPADFALDRGEAVQLSIAFSPAVAGGHSESFVVLCDNGTSTAHQLSGKGMTLSAAQLQKSLLVKPCRREMCMFAWNALVSNTVCSAKHRRHCG